MSWGRFISISIIDEANHLNPFYIIVCIYVMDKYIKCGVYRLIVSCEFRCNSSSRVALFFLETRGRDGGMAGRDGLEVCRRDERVCLS
jgi:hypothetical protein